MHQLWLLLVIVEIRRLVMQRVTKCRLSVSPFLIHESPTHLLAAISACLASMQVSSFALHISM